MYIELRLHFFFSQPDRIDYYRRQYCGIDSLLCPSPICQFHRFVYVARAAEAIGCSTFGYIDGVAIEELFKSSGNIEPVKAERTRTLRDSCKLISKHEPQLETGLLGTFGHRDAKSLFDDEIQYWSRDVAANGHR